MTPIYPNLHTLSTPFLMSGLNISCKLSTHLLCYFIYKEKGNKIIFMPTCFSQRKKMIDTESNMFQKKKQEINFLETKAMAT